MRTYNLRAPFIGRVTTYRNGPVDAHGQLAGDWVATLALSRPLSIGPADAFEARGATEHEAKERLVYTLSTLAAEIEFVTKGGTPR